MIFTSARQLKDRLRNEAHRLGIPPMTVMNHYMMERLLARLAASSYKDRVIIKGGLFRIRTHSSKRPYVRNRTTIDQPNPGKCLTVDFPI